MALIQIEPDARQKLAILSDEAADEVTDLPMPRPELLGHRFDAQREAGGTMRLPVASSAKTAGLSTIRAAAGLATGISITSMRNRAVRLSPGFAMQPASSFSSRTRAVPET